MPRPFRCSIGWIISPPEPKINAGFVSSGWRDLGHELRRPEADYLRDGIYELRVGLRGTNYRMVYFFHGRVAAVLAHGLVKEREVPPREIEEAIRRKRMFESNPERHTYKEG
jgi:phage-related protein